MSNLNLIDRQAAIDVFLTELTKRERKNLLHTWSTAEVKYFITKILEQLPSAQPYTEDYAELKREFIRMAEYVDMFLKCSDEQKETLIGFISRLAEFMPWTERD